MTKKWLYSRNSNNVTNTNGRLWLLLYRRFRISSTTTTKPKKKKSKFIKFYLQIISTSLIYSFLLCMHTTTHKHVYTIKSTATCLHVCMSVKNVNDEKKDMRIGKITKTKWKSLLWAHKMCTHLDFSLPFSIFKQKQSEKGKIWNIK